MIFYIIHFRVIYQNKFSLFVIHNRKTITKRKIKWKSDPKEVTLMQPTTNMT